MITTTAAQWAVTSGQVFIGDADLSSLSDRRPTLMRHDVLSVHDARVCADGRWSNATG